MQITIPTLSTGEHYAGIVVLDGKPTHHLVVLPGELDAATWKKAAAWAKEQGGELPNRREQALLFANAPEQFKSGWYWSNEQHAALSDFAWFQDFSDGYQSSSNLSSKLRARAVRRLIIE
jgi:hypothetical protein